TGLRAFVRALQPHLAALTPAELWAICAQNGLASSSKRDFAAQLTSGRLTKDDLERFVEGHDDLLVEVLEAIPDDPPADDAEVSAGDPGELSEVVMPEQLDEPLDDGLPTRSEERR